VPTPGEREATPVLGGDEEDGHAESKNANRKTKVP
jgi:hypothetical protein